MNSYLVNLSVSIVWDPYNESAQQIPTNFNIGIEKTARSHTYTSLFTTLKIIQYLSIPPVIPIYTYPTIF